MSRKLRIIDSIVINRKHLKKSKALGRKKASKRITSKKRTNIKRKSNTKKLRSKKKGKKVSFFKKFFGKVKIPGF